LLEGFISFSVACLQSPKGLCLDLLCNFEKISSAKRLLPLTFLYQLLFETAYRHFLLRELPDSHSPRLEHALIGTGCHDTQESVEDIPIDLALLPKCLSNSFASLELLRFLLSSSGSFLAF